MVPRLHILGHPDFPLGDAAHPEDSQLFNCWNFCMVAERLSLPYAYYGVEHGVTNCTTAYENNGGIASGTIVIKNTESENPAYTLPETGGAGTTPCTMGGFLLMTSAALLLLYNHFKRRKEDAASF